MENLENVKVDETTGEVVEQKPTKKPTKKPKLPKVALPVVRKVHNYEKPQVFNFDNKPLKEVEAVGYSVLNTETGEVLSERPNWFFPSERVGTPFEEVEVGNPLLVTVHRTRDIKENLKRLYGGDTQKMLSALYCDYNPEEEEKALKDMQEDGLTYDEDYINRLSGESPYLVGEDGLTGFERMVKEQGLEVAEAQKWLSMKDIVPQEWKDKSLDELKSTIEGLLSQAQSTGGNPPPTNVEE